MINNLLKMGGAPEGYDAALIVKEFEKSGAHGYKVIPGLTWLQMH